MFSNLVHDESCDVCGILSYVVSVIPGTPEIPEVPTALKYFDETSLFIDFNRHYFTEIFSFMHYY